MYLGRHTPLPWYAKHGPIPPHVLVVGDRRRVARVLQRLEDGRDVSAWCRAHVEPRAAGRVDIAIGRTQGVAVMVVETQMGGPATEIIVREVLDASFHPGGAQAVIRVGSCGTLGVGGTVPDLVVADFATGWSAAVEQERRGVLGPPAEFAPDRPSHPPVLPCTPRVADALATAAPGAVRAGVFSKDSLYAEQDASFAAYMRELGCAATEMELATIGPVAESLGVAWGGIMATAGCLGGEAWFDGARIERNEDLAIEAALAAVRTLARI